MFNGLFDQPEDDTNPYIRAVAALDAIYEASERLEKRKEVLLKNAATEREKALQFAEDKNKRAAIQRLKMKRLYEQQVEEVHKLQLRFHDLQFHLHDLMIFKLINLQGGAIAATETVDALRTWAGAMLGIRKSTNIDDIENTMDETNELTETLKTMQDSLKNSVIEDYDEDELKAELEKLESAELEQELLQPASTAPSGPLQVPTSVGRQPARMFDRLTHISMVVATLDTINEALEILEKKEKVLLQKAAAKHEEAIQFLRDRNKQAAIQCLKTRRHYERQVEWLRNLQLRFHKSRLYFQDQMILLERANATRQTVEMKAKRQYEQQLEQLHKHFQDLFLSLFVDVFI